MIKAYIQKHGLKLAFIISLVATLGSLFYSNVAGYTPCSLCWFQRIFIYPQVFLLGLALYKKEKVVIDYSLLLILVGGLISLYHNYIYYNAISTSFCASDEVAACATRYIWELGYITIPLMALSAFILIGLLLWQARNETI
jgi:disulfide bond formation protein DsbB